MSLIIISIAVSILMGLVVLENTFIYTTFNNLLKSQNKNVCCMAFIGIAATLLPKGRTVHKVLGLFVPLLSDFSSNITV